MIDRQDKWLKSLSHSLLTDIFLLNKHPHRLYIILKHLQAQLRMPNLTQSIPNHKPNIRLM